MNYFIYDGKKSSDYGVFISGTETYGAPARDVQAVQIPGRTGDLLLDNGRWENIPVRYPAFIPRHFSEDIGAFRAWLLASPGYKRLEDSYHPDEYRIAAYVSGLDTDNGVLNFSGRFDIEFTAKAQRYLKSGEEYTAPVCAGGNVAIKNPSGAVEIDNDWISTPAFVAPSGNVTATLRAIPQAGHDMDELANWLRDDEHYALFAHVGMASYSTATILPDIINGGYTATGIYIIFYVKKTPGFDWQVHVNYGSYEKTYNLAAEKLIYNPTLYEAEPLIKIEMDLSNSFAVGQRASFRLNGITAIIGVQNPYRILYYDCEFGDCYALDRNGNAINANQYLTMVDAAGNAVHEYPTLLPGENIIDFSVGNWLYYLSPAEISIMPRWWTL